METTDSLAARTIRSLSRTADPHWQGRYHQSMDLLADRTIRRLHSMQRSLARAAESEDRVAAARHHRALAEELRAKLDTASHLASMRPILHDVGRLVKELKNGLQFLADAEELQSPMAVTEAEGHVVEYIVQLLWRLADVDAATLEATSSVAELILESGVLLSARASCSDKFREAGALEMLVHLLEVQDSALMLERGAIIAANLAENALNRYHMRLEGGVRVLVSLLGDPLPNSVRVASATAIAIMCCSDGPCQDALRHADGLKYLVYLANSEDLRVAQVAKLAVDCACEHNAKNAAALMRALKWEQTATNGDFSRAVHLLSHHGRYTSAGSTYNDYAPASAPTGPSPYRSPKLRGVRSSGATPVSSLYNRFASVADPEAVGDGDEDPVLSHTRRRSPSPLSPPAAPSPRSRGGTPPTARYHSDVRTTVSPRKRSTSPSKETMRILRSSLDPATPAPYSWSEDEEVHPSPRRAYSASPTRPPPGSYATSPSVSGMRHLAAVRAPCMMTARDMHELVLEMGCSPREAGALLSLRVSGAEVLDLEEDMERRLGLGPELCRKLHLVQRAAEMFDRMTRTRMQGKMSELECRVFLATQGLRGYEVSDVAEQFRRMDTCAGGCVSFWEWCKAYDWFARILRAKGVRDVP